VKRILIGQEDLYGPWIAQRLHMEWHPGRGSIIGLWQDGVGPIAACLFEGCNGASVMLHCVGEGRIWLNREFLWFCFYYPFEQLKVNKIISPVESENFDSRNFIENIGFSLEATLKDASPKGDLLIYTLGKDQCKWLSLREKYRGQTKRSSST